MIWNNVFFLSEPHNNALRKVWAKSSNPFEYFWSISLKVLKNSYCFDLATPPVCINVIVDISLLGFCIYSFPQFFFVFFFFRDIEQENTVNFNPNNEWTGILHWWRYVSFWLCQSCYSCRHVKSLSEIFITEKIHVHNKALCCSFSLLSGIILITCPLKD